MNKKTINELLNILMYVIIIVFLYGIIIFISSHFNNVLGFFVFFAGLLILGFIIMNVGYVEFLRGEK